jgi:hypothetical protein
MITKQTLYSVKKFTVVLIINKIPNKNQVILHIRAYVNELHLDYSSLFLMNILYLIKSHKRMKS